MGEGNHAPQATANDTAKNNTAKSNLAMIAAGTVFLLLAGGVLAQFFRDPDAGTRKSAQADTESNTGKARVNQQRSQSSRAIARIVAGNSKSLISEDELAAECIRRVGKDVLDSLINRMIIQLACQERGIVVTEPEVSREIARMAADFKIDVKTWYDMLQSERELSPEQYRRDIIWPMLALRKLAGDKVQISESDMQKEFIRLYGPRVKARLIMLDNVRRANPVWEKAVKNPDDFGRLAREHSIDPNSRALDGSIPPIPHFSGNKELEDAAFKLREGEVSGIIHIGLKRYVILKCEGRTEPLVSNIEQVRGQLQVDLTKQKIQKAAAKIFTKLKENARVDNYLTGTSTGGVRQTSGTRTPGTSSTRNVNPAAGTATSKSPGRTQTPTRRLPAKTR